MAPGLRLLRGNVGLMVAPVVIAIAGVLLAVRVGGAEKDFSEASALQWSERLWPQLRRHIELTMWSTFWVLIIAIPLGILLTRPRLKFLAGPVLTVANSGQAIPAYGLLVLLAAWLGTTFSTAVIAFTIFAILPVLRNTMVGLDQVDKSVIEAGRGMGMSRRRALVSIELPLAVPVILAGVRTALVINVGMAALAFLIGGGGLGETINSGLKLQRDLTTFTGAAMVALLALTVDWIAAVAERVLRPRGL
ncbi:MAG: ABC transporter permease [Ilumatobacteraceae bacterium]|jgi:osmoprotectant transport system permease protein|nr:ABC transporter permease [Actinomycetota bacterium]NBU56573.1 ABC transporter permease [Acidimicrobiia bacterium]